MSGFGKPLHIRLFLEGIEVPVIAAQVTTHLNGPAAASIQVIPIDEALQLKPRTMVHLFFREKPATNDPDTGKLENYRLLFTGEIVGFAWIQKANARSVVLQCLDFSSYWDAALAASIDYGPQGDAFTHQASVVGAQVGILDNVINFEAFKLVDWLKEKPQTPGLQHVSGLAGGAIRMLEALSGIRNVHRGVNDFFTIGELRCRILEQICAEENDDTAFRLLKEKVFDEWVRNSLQNMGQSVSFRQMLIMLFKYIYYDFVPNPTAKYDASIEGKTSTKVEQVSVQKVIARLKAAERLSAIDTDIKGTKRNGDAARGVASTFVKALQEISASLQSAAGSFTSVQRAVKKIDTAISLLQDVEQTGSGENLQAIDEVGQAAAELRAADETKTVTSTTSTSVTARLRSHILRPDCWFAPPPRCNVIFPEHYTDLSYDRTYISEATRMLLFFNNTLVDPKNENILLSTKILAPSNAAEAKLIEGTKGAGSYRQLMKHELHTGVVAKMDWVPNTAAPVSDKTRKDDAKKIAGAKLSWGNKIALHNFFRERFTSRQASISGRFNPYVVCGFPGLVIKRPYLVRGATDADNSTDDVVLAAVKNGSPEGAPSQLLGMIHSVAHSINQSGGTTSLSMNYVREHLGVDDEFLGLFARTSDSTTKRVRTVLRLGYLLQKGGPDLQMLVNSTPQIDAPSRGPAVERGIDISKVSYTVTSIDPATGAATVRTETRDVARTTERAANAPPSPFYSNGRIDGLDRDLLVPTGSKLAPGSQGRYGKVVGIEVLDPNVTVLAVGEFENQKAFEAVAIYEEVTFSSTKKVAVEEIIRPDWFSSAYQNDQIGKRIYEPFFGTGSVTDDITVDSGGDTATETGVVTAQSDESKDELLARLDQLDGTKSGASIEKAVNLIGYLYGVAKEQTEDVDSFITQYTQRPIAGLADMLGDNVTYSIDGTKATPEPEVEDEPWKVGFHTHAVHTETASRGKLVGLLDDPNLQLTRINQNGEAGRIPEGYDVRNEKWERVLAYFEAIRNSPGGFRG